MDNLISFGKYIYIDDVHGYDNAFELQGVLSSGHVRRHGWAGKDVRKGDKEFMAKCYIQMGALMAIYEGDATKEVSEEVERKVREYIAGQDV